MKPGSTCCHFSTHFPIETLIFVLLDLYNLEHATWTNESHAEKVIREQAKLHFTVTYYLQKKVNAELEHYS